MNDRYESELAARALAEDVRHLYATGCADKALERKVRDFVAGELLDKADLKATVHALGLVNDDQANLLMDIVNQCATAFYQDGQVLSAIAVPVAMLWRSHANRIYTINKGGKTDLLTLAALIRQRVGAQKVVLGPELYTGQELLGTSVRDLRMRLQELLSGSSKLHGRPVPMSLKSQIDPQWQMLYFLGVEVQKDWSSRTLDATEVQRALGQWHYLGECAVVPQDAALLNGTPDRTAVCHGADYLMGAIATGEKALRSHRLTLLIEYVAQDAPCVEISYCPAKIQNYVDVLITGGWFTQQYRWKLFADETVDDFCSALTRAARRANQQCEEVVITELEQMEYANAKSKTKLVWSEGIHP